MTRRTYFTEAELLAIADAAQKPLRKYPAGWRWRMAMTYRRTAN